MVTITHPNGVHVTVKDADRFTVEEDGSVSIYAKPDDDDRQDLAVLRGGILIARSTVSVEVNGAP
jgi:hypothetical protein